MNAKELSKCHEQIKPYIHHTPVLTSSFLDKLTATSLFFKCENFQKMGAFKIRGATYALQQLSLQQKQYGVLTHSSGNFAQAISLAAKNLGIPAYIVMPTTTSQVKKEAVKSYGGIITDCAPTLEARERASEEIIEQTQASFIHPSNDRNVIIGNSTACKELLEDYPKLDAIFTAVGGGGLIAGTALAAHYFSTSCKVFAGEPLAVDDAFRSLKSGKIETNTTTNTIADGLKTNLGNINFPIIQSYVSDIIRVSESEIVNAMLLIWERMKIICEPSSAVAFAALLQKKKDFKGKKVGIILSGGNVDIRKLFSQTIDQ